MLFREVNWILEENIKILNLSSCRSCRVVITCVGDRLSKDGRRRRFLHFVKMADAGVFREVTF